MFRKQLNPQVLSLIRDCPLPTTQEIKVYFLKRTKAFVTKRQQAELKTDLPHQKIAELKNTDLYSDY